MAKNAKNPKTIAIFDGDLDEVTFNNFKDKEILAVDTEAMGLIHGRDRLCLVQLCDKYDNVVCIKINKSQKSAERLKYLMESIEIEKIFHFARFDVAALACNLNIKVNSIFCTKVASKLARTYSPRHGLKEVVFELLGIELDKQSQSSDWGKSDEFSNSQLIYAANDVRFLIPAKEHLEMILKREDRWDLAQNCFHCIPVMSSLDINHFSHIFEH